LIGLPALVRPAAQLAHLGPTLTLHVDLIRTKSVAAVATAIIQRILNHIMIISLIGRPTLMRPGAQLAHLSSTLILHVDLIWTKSIAAVATAII
jgi:hypothetical protein